MLIYLAYIFADNFILHKNDFKTLTIDKYVIESKRLKENEAVKISFPGTFYYRLEGINGHFKIKDKTVYLSKPEKKLILHFSLETYRYGLMEDTFYLIYFLLGLAFVSFVTFLVYIIK